MNKDFIPIANVKFLEWINPCVNAIVANAAAWNIPQEKAAGLDALRDVFEETFARAENPATRTSGNIAAKRTARAAVETALRETLKQYITYNPDISSEQRLNMGLPVHKTTYTPVPAPATYPDLVIEPDGIRRICVHFRDHDKRSAAKPRGVVGAMLRYAILPAPPAVIEELANTVFDTKTPYVFSFDEHERGKMLYVCAAWQNTKGERGAWSEIVSTIVP